MKNAFTVDLEDWYNVYNFSRAIDREDWGSLESRVERNTARLLEILSKRGVKATFFVLGWIAERRPGLVREVESAGHEIASHGYSHRLLTEMTPDSFSAELDRSLGILRGIVKQDLAGFRAPSFSLTGETMWAVEILRRNGIKYDSTIFPTTVHPDYGLGGSPLTIHELAENFWEVPLSCLPVLRWNVPFSGGGYFRILPYALTKKFFESFNRKTGPVVFYLHPWELDPGQPRVRGVPWSKRFRHYVNLDKTEGRLDRLLGDFEFVTVRDLLGR
jgi:polysaccharide deacetylase family protein (PEP-CTERM system associated)